MYIKSFRDFSLNGIQLPKTSTSPNVYRGFVHPALPENLAYRGTFVRQVINRLSTVVNRSRHRYSPPHTSFILSFSAVIGRSMAVKPERSAMTFPDNF